MRYFIFILLFTPNVSMAQVVYSNYASSAYQANDYGQAAINYSYGGASVDYSIAAINQQTAYTMYLQNRVNAVDSYFQRRQMNTYYRELEQLQKEAIREAKYSGSWNVQELNNLYHNNQYPLRTYNY
jgi:hypothetical protein